MIVTVICTNYTAVEERRLYSVKERSTGYEERKGVNSNIAGIVRLPSEWISTTEWYEGKSSPVLD